MLVVSRANRLGIIPNDHPTVPMDTEATRAQDQYLQQRLDAVDEALRDAARTSAAIRQALRFPLDSVRLEEEHDPR